MGPIVPFPEDEDSCEIKGDIPKVIHQVCFSKDRPTRWIDTWKVNFCGANPGWKHRLWTYEDLRNEKEGYFCSHLYPDQHRHFDEDTLKMLMLEILYKHGGYYVPLTSIYDESSADNAGEKVFPPVEKKNGALAGSNGGIVGSIKNGLACMKMIKSTYSLGKMPKIHQSSTTTSTDVKPMDIADSTTAYLAYPTGSRYLGVSKVIVSNDTAADLASTIVYAYDAQVPIRICKTNDELLAAVIENSDESAVVLTDCGSNITRNPHVMDSIAGLIYQTEQTNKDWNYLTLSIQWNTGCSDHEIRAVNDAALPEELHCFGVVLNAGNSADDLVGSNDGNSHIIERILSMHSDKRVYSGIVKFTHDKCMSALYSSMPVVSEVFSKIANHTIPPWDCADEREMHGRLMKGTRNGGQLAFELNVDDNNNIFYRAFNDDGALNCEIRINQGLAGKHVVEHARVYYDHTIVYEGSQVRV